MAATRDLATIFVHSVEHMFRDKELARLRRIGIHDYTALEGDDRMRVALMWFSLVRAMEQ